MFYFRYDRLHLCRARDDRIRARAGEASARKTRNWRRGSESNRRPRLCRPLHDHSATPPCATEAEQRALRLRLFRESGAGKESRTPDLNLGKVALYQLSYSRGITGNSTEP